MKRITVIIVIVAVILLSLYDIVAAIYGGDGSTISEVIRNAAYKAPIVPFVFGVLCGHWFFSKQ